MRVQEVGQRHQLVLDRRARQRHELVERRALIGEDQQHRAALAHRQQLHVLNAAGVKPRGAHDRRALRQDRGDLGRLGQNVVEVPRVEPELVQHPQLLFGQVARRLHQQIHEHAVAGVRRDAAGRRVGLLEQPFVLEIGHFVAQRRGREPEVELLRQRARPDGLGGEDVVLDDGLEDLLLAGRQEHDQDL
ncbi:hypothetical protein D3C72_1533110 [compost metagenome]